MKSKLEILADLVETETGLNIRKRNRRREVTYARALYCKLARDVREEGDRYSYKKIGNVISKDHATVMHNINVIFPSAMKEQKYKYLYNEVDTNKDGQVSDKEIKKAKEILYKANIRNNNNEFY